MHVCLHLCVHICRYVCVRVQVCVHVCLHVCTCMGVCACMSACVYMYGYVDNCGVCSSCMVGGWWDVQLLVSVWHVWVEGCAVTCGCGMCGSGVCSYLWVRGMCGWWCVQLSWMYEFLECGVQLCVGSL